MEDVGHELSIGVSYFGQVASHIAEVCQIDGPTPVGLLPRFDNPHLIRFPLVLLQKPGILMILHRSHVVGLGQIGKRIPLGDIGVVVVQRFKQIFLGAYAVVVGEMVGEDVRLVLVVERNAETLGQDIFLY